MNKNKTEKRTSETVDPVALLTSVEELWEIISYCITQKKKNADLINQGGDFILSEEFSREIFLLSSFLLQSALRVTGISIKILSATSGKQDRSREALPTPRILQSASND